MRFGLRSTNVRTLLAAALVAAAVAVAGPAAAEGKRALVVGMQLEPPHLDPTAGAAAAIKEVTYANIFEGLTRIDAAGRIVPGLAESWSVSDDGLTYSFQLRHDAVFHDGTPFDSGIVRFSLDRARGPNSVNAQKAFFAPIKAIDTPDPWTVIVTLSRADGLFLFHLGQGDAVMVSPKSAETNKQTPVGTGPFKFGRWVTGDRVVLVKNADFRDKGLPKLDQVTFRFISDPTAEVNALLSGDVDAFPNIGATESLDQFKGDPRFAVTIGTTEGETILALNERRKPFDDVRVRRALSFAIDRQSVIDGAQFGYGTPIGSHFAPHREGYVDLTGVYPHDVSRAKALLAEAGYPNGFGATLKLPPPPYARRSGEIVAALLADVGVKITIVPVEWAQWLEQVFKGYDYDLSIVSHVEPLDIDIYDRPDYYFGYRSDRFHGVMEQLDHTIDTARRAALYGDAQRILAEDAANIFLFQLAETGVRRADIVGLWDNRPIPAIDVTAVSWK